MNRSNEEIQNIINKYQDELLNSNLYDNEQLIEHFGISVKQVDLFNTILDNLKTLEYYEGVLQGRKEGKAFLQDQLKELLNISE